MYTEIIFHGNRLYIKMLWKNGKNVIHYITGFGLN